MTERFVRIRRWGAGIGALGVLVGAGAVVGAPAAVAAGASVSIANEFGTGKADTTYSTDFTVTGSGFQSVQGAFGGIYVLFGWVSDPAGDGWKPSSGGSTGITYRYVPDSEEKDNAGFQRFVSFPGSETEYAANGGIIAADGSWSLSMTVPGPTFQAYDRDNNAVDIDCLKVTCGIITVGAHGVVNANNETFTPIEFGDIYSGAAPSDTSTAAAEPTETTPATEETGEPVDTAATAPAATTPTATAPAAPAPSSGAPTTSGPAEPASAEVDRATAVAGRVLSFFGRGFHPGEQVLATLDDGLSSVGPLVAGTGGALAGILQLPLDLSAGTHVLRIQGAESGQVVEVAFPVMVSGAVTADTTEAVADEAVRPTAAVVEPSRSGTAIGFVVAAGIGVLVAAGLALRTWQRNRRAGTGEPDISESTMEGPA
ncbi:hypothetical protein D1871_09885 [Nakamurella silvestris]|nr:hypothetical protein D1871_09885 [Nakamurella silvestris]